MKKILLLLFVSVLGIGLNQSCAQDKEKKKIEKELWVEDNDGNLKVIITEKDGDMITKEVLTGEEAEKYLDENNEHNVMVFRDGDESENVMVIEMKDGEGGAYSWVSDEDMEFDFDFDFGELEEKLAALQEDLEDLEKEEIAERLEEIMEMKEEMHTMKAIHLEKIHEELEEHRALTENIDVTVEEKDGVMIITKTIGDTKEVQEIIIDEDNKDKKVVVVKSSTGSGHAKSGDLVGSMDNLNMNVYPNPNKGEFTIELDLKSEEEAMVKVTDSAGKEVYRRAVKGIEKHKLEVKLKKPSAGLYVITVEQGNSKMKMKTIVE